MTLCTGLKAVLSSQDDPQLATLRLSTGTHTWGGEVHGGAGPAAGGRGPLVGYGGSVQHPLLATPGSILPAAGRQASSLILRQSEQGH